MGSQQFFDDLFADQSFGPRNGFMPRDWQVECLDQYQFSVASWLERSKSNGAAINQLRYCIYSAVASGKTKASALIASYLLNSKYIDMIVVVVPNRSISVKTREEYRKHFGIDLVRFHKGKHKDGLPRLKQGYILTYAHLMQEPDLHRRICGPNTLVIFDEVHHLGDSSTWGAAAQEAFGRTHFVVSLTGTPYRSDNTLIPFVAYEDTETEGLRRFRPDFAYSLGRAIIEGVCREPVFVWSNGTVEIRPPGMSGTVTVTFKDTNIKGQMASLRLSGAVKYPSPARKRMLQLALERCRLEGRKVIIFVGGDTEGETTPTIDATEYLPSELEELGITPDEFDVVTGDDPEAQTKIREFGPSKKWILVSINMVSEGTDIPELSAAIFLTSITAKQTTIQRIGRVLRYFLGSHPAALIFMFEDPEHLDVAANIRKEIEIETQLSKARAERESSEARGDSPNRKAEASCREGGDWVAVTINGTAYPVEMVMDAEKTLVSIGLPRTMLGALLKIIAEEQSRAAS